MKPKHSSLYDIALVSPPWWLIPSTNIVTATEHIIEDYAFNFKKYGYKSVIFSRGKDNTDIEDIKDLNKYNNEFIYTNVSVVDRKYLKEKNSIFFYLLYIIKVSLKIKRYNISKVIVFQTFPFVYWIKLINPKVKILYYTVNHELSKSYNYYKYGNIPKRLALKVLPKIHCIVSMSNYIRDGIVGQIPSIRDKCKTVYIGIDTKIFKKKTGTSHKRIIIYSGRVVPEKGIHLLVSAFKNLYNEFSDIELYILGAAIGPKIPKSYFNIFDHKKIKVLGLLPRAKVAKMLEKASVFVYPVIWEEPFGLAPVEAMSVGIPVVVSDGESGYTEIITKENGFYFKRNDEVDLERILREILTNPGVSKSKVNNAINTVKEKLSWEECIHNTIDCFN